MFLFYFFIIIFYFCVCVRLYLKLRNTKRRLSQPFISWIKCCNLNIHPTNQGEKKRIERGLLLFFFLSYIYNSEDLDSNKVKYIIEKGIFVLFIFVFSNTIKPKDSDSKKEKKKKR